MIRFIAQLFLVFLLVFFVGGFFSFWVLMILTGIGAFFLVKNNTVAFFSSGLGFGLAWLVKAFVITVETASHLPQQMAVLMGVSNENLLFVATFVIGFLIGGFSGLTGGLLKSILQNKREGYYGV
ncbi:hypothetical protein IPZ59_10980 [Mongoliitalea daihaiensis]|nr:hypothetical protein IPZ59_10980 [Mongoliitalea daihaiensis]